MIIVIIIIPGTIIKVRYNKKVFIENSTGIKNYPVSVNKVIS